MMTFPSRLPRLLLVAVCLHGAATLQAADSAAVPAPSVIPQPAVIEMGEGVFSITSATLVYADGDAKAEAETLLDEPRLGSSVILFEKTYFCLSIGTHAQSFVVFRV